MNEKDRKKYERRGKYATFVVKYNKIFWVLLIALALYLGRGNFSTLIHTFRDWDEIQAAKGDVILQQRLFHSDRFYLEDPESFSEVRELSQGTYSYNLREGSDITLEQEKFLFANGDTYRHVTLPYVDTIKIYDVDTLKMFTRFAYSSGSAYYYDFEKGAWDSVKSFRGGSALPQHTLMYMNFNDQYYVLMDQLYGYNDIDEGVVECVDELTHLAHVNRVGNLWEIIMPYSMREGMEYQRWTLESTEPLIDMESGEILAGTDTTEKELILKALGLGDGSRWLADGYYSPVEEGYSPAGENYYYRSDNAQQLDLLLAAEDSRVASELAYVQVYKMAQNINENGYFEMPLQNSKLYSDYGIRYGYADLKANAAIGQTLITAANRYGKDDFREPIEALADFFAQRLAEGGLPEYWHYKGEIKRVPASSETKKAAAAFLKAAGQLLDSPRYAELADSLK